LEIRLEVSMANVVAQALYRACGFREAGVPIRRVKGRVVLRAGPIEVDDNLLVLAKRLDG
jgi:ribosomal protein S18 acetylase RimI-like enzyme